MNQPVRWEQGFHVHKCHRSGARVRAVSQAVADVESGFVEVGEAGTFAHQAMKELQLHIGERDRRETSSEVGVDVGAALDQGAANLERGTKAADGKVKDPRREKADIGAKVEKIELLAGTDT